MIQRMLLFILIVQCPLGLVWAEDWPQWRGPERTGASKEKGLLDSWPAKRPKLLWTFREAGSGYSGMAVVGDRLYAMGGEDDKEYVFAVDLKTQKKLWSTAVGKLYSDGYGEGPRGTPTIDGNYLYTIGGNGSLVCVETSTGRKIWSQGLKTDLGGLKPGYGYSESPLVDGDQVIATPGGKQGAIAAFDKKTGTLKWRSTASRDATAFSSMITVEVKGVRQYVQIHGKVVGVRASDGKPLWEFPFSSINTPIYQSDCIYVCSRYSGCRRFKLTPDKDSFKTEPIYANPDMQSYCGGAILVGDYLYGCCDKGGWMCQDFKTGKKIWNQKTKLGRGSLTYADGNLYGYQAKGDVLLIQATPTGYKERGKFHLPEETQLLPPEHEWHCTHPVVANGRLYLRDQDLIFCYDIRKPR